MPESQDTTYWDSDLTGPHEYTDEDDPVACSCGRETAGEGCGQCGEDLCPMCYESGAGFCSKHPDEFYGLGPDYNDKPCSCGCTPVDHSMRCVDGVYELRCDLCKSGDCCDLCMRTA